MCGRYRLTRPDRIAAMMEVERAIEEFGELKLLPRFNIAPSQHVPIIRMNAAGHPAVTAVKWGLIPHFIKGKPKFQPANAKAETVATSNMFRQAFERRRCLIPADGFYEPLGPPVKHGQPARKQYFFRHPDDHQFAFAGLWERWTPDPAAEPVDTFTLITKAPDSFVGAIHDRMPIILDPKDYDRWLDRAVPGEDVANILSHSATEGMERYRVDEILLNTVDSNRRPLDVPECCAHCGPMMGWN